MANEIGDWYHLIRDGSGTGSTMVGRCTVCTSRIPLLLRRPRTTYTTKEKEPMNRLTFGDERHRQFG
ncbi:hypothetical protein TanjilG_21788 [Lupinus angustifolius]|nr:hypothetical protein TanjilG_21788 [Lupinus angustifolius]